MARKRKSQSKTKILDKAIAQMEKAQEILEDNAVEDDNILIPQVDIEDEAQQEISDLFDALPGSDEYYLKVYKIKPLPPTVRGPEFKTEIYDTSSITDLEVTVRDLCIEYDWGPGQYKVEALRKQKDNTAGRPKRITNPAFLLIDYPPKKKSEEKTSPNLMDELSNMAKLSSIIKEIVPQRDPNAEFTKYLGESFKSSIETMKEFMPKVPENGNQQVVLLEIIKGMKEAGIIGKDTSKPISFDDIIKLLPIIITAVKELKIFERKPEKDIFADLIRLRESGLIKIAGEEKREDPIDSISKITKIINLLTPLMRGDDNASIGIELVRTLGPQVPKIVENVTGTIKDVAEVAKLKLANQMNLPPEYLHNPNMKVLSDNYPENIEQPTGQIIPPPPSSPSLNKEPEKPMRNPMLQQVLDAINSDNREYFNTLKQLIPLYINKEAVDGLVNGAITPEVFVQSISEALKEPELNTEKSRQYMTAFVQWMREEETKNIIVIKCGVCHAEFEMSPKEWENDNKKCDCGGDLEQIGP